MTAYAQIKVVVPCENPKCMTKDGNPHTLMVIETEYAQVTQTCRHCRTHQTRIILAGKVIESRMTP